MLDEVDVQLGSNIWSGSDLNGWKEGCFGMVKNHSKSVYSVHYGPVLEWSLEIRTKNAKISFKKSEFWRVRFWIPSVFFLSPLLFKVTCCVIQLANECFEYNLLTRWTFWCFHFLFHQKKKKKNKKAHKKRKNTTEKGSTRV